MRRVTGFEAQLWRALRVFRVATLVYAVILIGKDVGVYRYPVAAWVVAGVMTGWTAVSVVLYGRRPGRPWPLLIADLAIMIGCLVATVPVTGLDSLAHSHTLPSVAVAGAVLAWAVGVGRMGAIVSSLLVGVIDVGIRGQVNQNTLNSAVVLVLAAVGIGYVADLGRSAHQQLAEAVRLDTETRYRQRLARDIHDSVLQVLALVARRAQDLGGEAAELGRLAGEQEAALRNLINTDSRPPADGLTDLRSALDAFASPTVVVSKPATPVTVPTAVCDELVTAVRSAVENVTRHAGAQARAWILIEADQTEITVTVRDDGLGFAHGRLEQAGAQGRLGVAQSITARVRDLGGDATVTSTPGQGTEVELRVPTHRDA